MSTIVKEKDGRTWSGGSDATKATRRFQLILDSASASAGLTYTGLPAVGDAHPSLEGLKVSSIDFSQGKDGEKTSVDVTVNYSANMDEGSGENIDKVEEWGWDAGTEEKELTMAADGTAVLNSAGDVFESVPTISSPAPVFTKVIKSTVRKSGAIDFNCKTNSSNVSISGKTFPPGSLLCTVAEQRIIGSSGKFKYKYTIQLKYKSNLVKLEGANQATDIGWDVSITDAGMRELDSETGLLKLIKIPDSETGQLQTVTSPELLDGDGAAIVRTQGETPTPYNFRFQAYERESIPNWFYSEPT